VTLAAVSAGAAAALIVVGLADLLGGLTNRPGVWLEKRMRAGRERRARASPLVRIRTALTVALVRAARLVGAEPVRPYGDLRTRVCAAGRPGGLRERDWAALKRACAVAAAAMAVFVAASVPWRLGVALLAAAPAAGFVAPDFVLARMASMRIAAALAELPGMLDLLRVTVEAGQSPTAALGAVGARFGGPLAAEWRAAAARVALGMPQDAALAQMAERLPAPEVRALADALRSARRRGLPIADVLAAQATAARHGERQRIRERAARAGPQIQLVVALVLVPSVLLTIAAVLVTELTATGLGLAP
jgi:tight adherence protein C